MILQVDNLTKRFGRLTALDDVSFSIQKGNVYGILGPNGSGKSTVLGIVLDVVNKTTGSYAWFGGSVDTHQALKKVGAIIERPNFYPYMSAYQNLKLVAKIKKVPYAKIDEKLALVGLLERKNSPFRTFSLGMKQRLAIASALLNDPEVLILDEPTNGLDPEGITQIREIIKKIAQQGTSILLASHLLDEVEKVCTHLVIIKHGKMLYNGSMVVKNQQQSMFELDADDKTKLIEVLQLHPNFDRFEQGELYINVYFDQVFKSSDLNRYLSQKEVYLTHLVERKKKLEELFLEIIQK
ncbi:MAG: ATP-binding cassette domain-containing protein [Bacteroidota bacterium]|nr:ATP-binding cassette domain-containing protein [Bacteroidota bacterium]